MTGFLRLSIRGRCLAVLVLLSVIGACGARTSAIADPITLALKDGPVTGLVENGVLTVKGVPFAAPPVGELRWRPTQKVAPWTAPRAAEHFSAACPQTFNPESSAKPEPISEDCLYLNVWAPAKAGSKRLPVMVWIHGGSWTNGSGSRPLYDGTRFAHDGVILVTFNYRLGALGFFAHPALTAEAAPDAPLFAYGHLDQIAALQWVQANIARFGGDPGDVTVFGESAGAGSLLALLSIPQTQGLFARAIVESAPALSLPSGLKSAEGRGKSYLASRGVKADATAADLRALPVESLIGSYDASLVPDGRLQKETYLDALAAGRAVVVPMIIGSNSDEGSLVQYYRAMPALMLTMIGPHKAEALQNYGAETPSDAALGRTLFADAVFGAPSRRIASLVSPVQPAYLYRFDYVAEEERGVRTGARHGGELEFVFGTLGKGWVKSPTPADFALSETIHACFLAFAKTGKPCANWPVYDPKTDQTLVFDPSGAHAVAAYRKAPYDLLDSLSRNH